MRSRHAISAALIALAALFTLVLHPEAADAAPPQVTSIIEGRDADTDTPVLILMGKRISAYREFDIVTEFDEVNVGIYQKRSVAGTLSLWDRKEKRKTWISKATVKNEVLASSDEDAIAKFIGGIGRAWFERLKGHPLGPETKEFVRLALESLPRKP